jgi:ribosomal protein S4
MAFVKNRRYKPFYKKFIALKQNLGSFKKIFNFKRRKWQRVIVQLKRIQNKTPREFQLYDHFIYFLPKYSNSLKTSFSYNLRLKKILQTIYGKLLIRRLKSDLVFIFNNRNLTKTSTNLNLNIIKLFENRLDTILFRSNFVFNIKIARQLILHKHITVNEKLAKQSSQELKPGDLVKVNDKYQQQIAINIGNLTNLRTPPKYLEINYRIFQILYLSIITKTNISTLFPFWLDLNAFLKRFKK